MCENNGPGRQRQVDAQRGYFWLKPARIIALCGLLAIFVSCLGSITVSRAASAGQFASTNAAITNAYTAVAGAKQAGGNVSTLIANLNLALNLTELAQAINSSNPSESTLLLQNATRIAQQVGSQAVSAQTAGASAKQILTEESIGGAIATIIVAALIYIYGGRIYRAMWFRLYKNYVVKRAGRMINNG